MYCVRCDAQGQLDHATVIYGGESLCEPHFKWVREMNLSGSFLVSLSDPHDDERHGWESEYDRWDMVPLTS